jgi:hypothetical protein
MTLRIGGKIKKKFLNEKENCKKSFKKMTNATI